MPVALIELIVAVAVAAAARVPAKSALATNKLKITFEKKLHASASSLLWTSARG
jgi:hypothetical protein